jgi:hypothetical protein
MRYINALIDYQDKTSQRVQLFMVNPYKLSLLTDESKGIVQ